MILGQVIENVKRIKNGYEVQEDQIIADINTVEALIMAQVVAGRDGDNEIITTFGNYNVMTSRDTELFTPVAFDKIYQMYCCAQIDLQYEDSERYENDIIIYNSLFDELKAYWRKTHQQKKRYTFHI